MQFDQHLKIMTLLKSDKPQANKWISIISFMKQIPEEEISLWPLNEFMTVQNEIAAELNSLVLDAKEIFEFDYNGDHYKVDTTVLNANTALYADYTTLTERYKDSLHLYKHIFALLVYQETQKLGIDSHIINGNEVYTTQRYEKNLFMVGKLPVEIVYGVSNFFLRLAKSSIELSQQYSNLDQLIQ